MFTADDARKEVEITICESPKDTFKN